MNIYRRRALPPKYQNDPGGLVTPENLSLSPAPKVRSQFSQGQRPWKDDSEIKHQRCGVIVRVWTTSPRCGSSGGALGPGALPLAKLRSHLWCCGQEADSLTTTPSAEAASTLPNRGGFFLHTNLAVLQLTHSYNSLADLFHRVPHVIQGDHHGRSKKIFRHPEI
jgi:hypothetical protein